MTLLDEFRQKMKFTLGRIHSTIPDDKKNTLIMRAFGLTKVPLLFMASPKVTRLDEDSCHVTIPFRKLVKNHVGSLYFGAFAIGADACVGMAALDEIQATGENISLIFKDFQAEFLKRAEGDTLFICSEKQIIRELVKEAINTKQRVHRGIHAEAHVAGELVAKFVLTLSLKLK